MVRLLGLGLAFCLAGCQRSAIVSSPPSTSRPAIANEIARGAQPFGKSEEIRGLIEQLVYHANPNDRQPVDANSDEGKRIRERMRSCQAAFDKLSELREVAFPYLVAHLDDKRPSIPFRNHYIGSTVGDACYSNILFQLLDRPQGYSEYGYARKGRDGNDHRKPYWSCGSIFEGGLKEWLDRNRNLSYVEKQIYCLTWLLDREKEIGAPDAESYYRDILPLEIQILRRRLEKGDDVSNELNRLIEIRDQKKDDQIPPDLLPAR